MNDNQPDVLVLDHFKRMQFLDLACIFAALVWPPRYRPSDCLKCLAGPYVSPNTHTRPRPRTHTHTHTHTYFCIKTKKPVIIIFIKWSEYNYQHSTLACISDTYRLWLKRAKQRGVFWLLLHCVKREGGGRNGSESSLQLICALQLWAVLINHSPLYRVKAELCFEKQSGRETEQPAYPERLVNTTNSVNCVWKLYVKEH